MRRLKAFGDRLTTALMIAFVIIITLEAWQYISSLRSPAPTVEFETVSLVQLLANPERYDGRKIRAAGFFVYKGEQQALFLSSEDAENGISQNGITVALQSPAYKQDDLASLDRKFISVKGAFVLRGAAGARAPQIVGIEEVRSPPYAAEPATLLQPAKTDPR
jgi:hypothetical protein